MLCLPVLGFLALSYALYRARFYNQRRKLLRRSWDDLLASIQSVNNHGISTVALAYLNPTSEQLRMQPFEMWALVGRQEGLDALNANAQAMLDLALYAAQWDHVEGRIVGEMMRRDAVRLRQATRQIRMAVLNEKAEKFAAFELQEAAAAYHLMRHRLHGLYKASNATLYPAIAGAI